MAKYIWNAAVSMKPALIVGMALRCKRVILDALDTARQASKAKGNFRSQMSHEIRTPLNAIIGYLTLMSRSGQHSGDFQHNLKNSLGAAQQLLAIINDILDIASIESGRMKIAKTPFSIHELLEETANLFQAQADPDIRFFMETAGD